MATKNEKSFTTRSVNAYQRLSRYHHFIDQTQLVKTKGKNHPIELVLKFQVPQSIPKFSHYLMKNTVL